MSETVSLLTLPQLVLDEIAGYLNPRSFLNLRETCRVASQLLARATPLKEPAVVELEVDQHELFRNSAYVWIRVLTGDERRRVCAKKVRFPDDNTSFMAELFRFFDVLSLCLINFSFFPAAMKLTETFCCPRKLHKLRWIEHDNLKGYRPEFKSLDEEEQRLFMQMVDRVQPDGLMIMIHRYGQLPVDLPLLLSNESVKRLRLLMLYSDANSEGASFMDYNCIDDEFLFNLPNMESMSLSSVTGITLDGIRQFLQTWISGRTRICRLELRLSHSAEAAANMLGTLAAANGLVLQEAAGLFAYRICTMNNGHLSFQLLPFRGQLSFRADHVRSEESFSCYCPRKTLSDPFFSICSSW